MTSRPIIAKSINELQAILRAARKNGQQVGLVPTMGNLHAGHLSLVKYAQKITDIVVVSIFVNPMQFGPNEDFARYPRTQEQDLELLSSCGPVVVFAPAAEELYPQGLENHTQVQVPRFEGLGCALSRPHFFTGVATVVMKLFSIVQPDKAIFGEKDFQQLLVIKQFVQDLCLPIQVLGRPIVREQDGLAMSSRNRYLTAQERQCAPKLYETLQTCAQQLLKGARDYRQLEKIAKQNLSALGFVVDYFTINSRVTFAPVTADHEARDIVIAAAAVLGKARLIDNVSLSLA